MPSKDIIQVLRDMVEALGDMTEALREIRKTVGIITSSISILGEKAGKQTARIKAITKSVAQGKVTRLQAAGRFEAAATELTLNLAQFSDQVEKELPSLGENVEILTELGKKIKTVAETLSNYENKVEPMLEAQVRQSLTVLNPLGERLTEFLEQNRDTKESVRSLRYSIEGLPNLNRHLTRAIDRASRNLVSISQLLERIEAFLVNLLSSIERTG
jgi:chromosome segregation ATPase